jgi:DNA-binding transcriptional regulator LsrR (DeoR family)
MRIQDPEASHRCLTVAAARLRSDGAEQKDIAPRLGISQPKVSRLLKEAVEKKYLSRGPALLRANIAEEDYKAAEIQYFYRDDLARKFEKLVPAGHHFEVRVIPAAEDAFAFGAAGRVLELLGGAHRIGIMWGRTILRVIDGILSRGDAFNSKKNKHIETIPLCGDPLFLMNDRRVKYSASHLAAALGQAINPSRVGSLPCLIGVPAYISRKLALQGPGSELSWERFLQGIRGYQQIFGGGDGKSQPMVDEVDTIITGTGVIVLGEEKPGSETGDLIMERVHQEGLEKRALAELIYGDIGGWLIEREGLKSDQLKTVQDLNAGWTGIGEKHLKQVARKARATGSPGVVVIACGKRKAAMVTEIIRRGCVNQLVVDPTLAQALRKS